MILAKYFARKVLPCAGIDLIDKAGEGIIMKINETIRARRKELNLTQEQVADYLGVTAPAVHKWEKGVSQS